MQKEQETGKGRSEFERRPLWAPWRLEYIRDIGTGEGCFFCRKAADFQKDRENFVIARGQHVFLLLNAFPYNSGHTLVAPYRHVADFSECTAAERQEMMELAAKLKDVIAQVMQPQGFNFGFNLGEAAGAGIASHIHGHLVPRWAGDTNFMPVLADTRVVPEALEKTTELLRQAWCDEYGDT